MEKRSPNKSFLYKSFFNWPVAIFLLTIDGILLMMFVIFYLNFMRVNEIQMVHLNGAACQMTIPVRYIYPGKKLEHAKVIPFVSANGWRYSIRQNNQNDEIWIQISRWGFGGLAAYTARYEIVDPIAKKRLMGMMTAQDIESEITMQKANG